MYYDGLMKVKYKYRPQDEYQIGLVFQDWFFDSVGYHWDLEDFLNEARENNLSDDEALIELDWNFYKI